MRKRAWATGSRRGPRSHTHRTAPTLLWVGYRGTFGLRPACTSRHSFSETMRSAGASRRTTASGDGSVTDVPRRLVCRVLPQTLTPAYVSLARIAPTWVGDHNREPRGEATPSRSSSLAILK